MRHPYTSESKRTSRPNLLQEYIVRPERLDTKGKDHRSRRRNTQSRTAGDRNEKKAHREGRDLGRPSSSDDQHALRTNVKTAAIFVHLDRIPRVSGD